MRFIIFCNQNSGFFSFVFGVLTLIVSIIAIVFAIHTAQIPYKKDLKIITSLNENSKGIPILEITLLNTGNCAMYLEGITLSQPSIMPFVFLGFLKQKDIQKSSRVLVPNCPVVHNVLMDNYNENEYDHYSYPIIVQVTTTKKTFTFETDWESG